MNLPHRLLFYYCLLFVLFLIISGIASSKSQQEMLLQLLLIPTLLYFFSVLMREILHKENKREEIITERLSLKRKSLLFFVGTLLLLVISGAYRIFGPKQLIQSPLPLIPNPTRSANKAENSIRLGSSSGSGQTKITPSTKTIKQYIQLNLDYANNVANIREEPNAKAKIILKAKNKEIFPLISEVSGWLKIQLPSGQNGYILKSFTTPYKQ